MSMGKHGKFVPKEKGSAGAGSKDQPQGRKNPPPAPAKSRGAGGTGAGGSRPRRSQLRRLLGNLAALPGYVTEHTPGGPAFAHAVAFGLQTVPHAIHDFLHGEGHTVVVGDLLVNIDPSLRGQRPRGYPPGTTWERASGCFQEHTKRVLVAEFFVVKGVRRPTYNVEGVCREETGHSLDWALGAGGVPVSHTDRDFLRAYRADVRRITDPAERQVLAYLLQPGGAGNEEAFAQPFAILYGGGSGLRAFNQLVEQRFPRTLQALRKIVPVSRP